MWEPEVLSLGAKQSLLSGLGLLRHGCVMDFTTRLIDRRYKHNKDAGRSACAAEFKRSQSCDLHPAHLSAEMRQEAKHGTYSKRPPFSIPDDTGISMDVLIRRYFSAHRCSIGGAALQYADDAVDELITGRMGHLLPSSLRVAADSFTGRTGLGWPVMTSDREVIPDVYRRSAEIVSSHYNPRYCSAYPAIAGFRGQPRGPNRFCKFRVIYQIARTVSNLEKQLQIPLMKSLKPLQVFAAWTSRDAVDTAVTRLLLDRRGRKMPLVSIDFSNFDASVPRDVIDRVFRIVGGWFRQASKLMEFVRRSFNETGIIIPTDGSWEYLPGEERQGGIPSGSALTNLIGSLVNLWVVHYAARREGGWVVDCLVNGDDGVYRFSGTTIESISRRLLNDLGMTVSVEKSLVSTREVHYLQMVHHRDIQSDGVCRGVRPLMRVLNGMMSYEDVNRRWDQLRESHPAVSFDSFRWLQQLDNANYHPGFEQACQWLLEKDGHLQVALDAVLTNNRVILEAAKMALCGKHEWGKVAVDGLLTSPVVQTCLTLLLGRRNPN